MYVRNVEVYGLGHSIKASKYPMSVSIEDCFGNITDTVKALASSAPGSGHDQFLTGIIVQFDLKCSIKMWVEAERYHFFDFVSSQSTMHRITKLDPEIQCNDYVEKSTIETLKRLIEEYNADPDSEKYLRVLYNVPTGFELAARMTTNFRQLKIIYNQRKNHRLPEWRAFCRWIEDLPFFSELCLGGKHEQDS